MNALENLKEICHKETPGIWHVHKQPGDGLAPGFGPKNNPVGECWHIKDAVAIAVTHNSIPALIELVESQGKLIESLKCGGFFREDSPGLSRIEQARAKLEESMR